MLKCVENVNIDIYLVSGIAINKDGVIYVADGANIRKIDTNKIISTVIGSQDQPKAWKPMSCDESMPADQVIIPFLSVKYFYIT